MCASCLSRETHARRKRGYRDFLRRGAFPARPCSSSLLLPNHKRARRIAIGRKAPHSRVLLFCCSPLSREHAYPPRAFHPQDDMDLVHLSIRQFPLASPRRQLEARLPVLTFPAYFRRDARVELDSREAERLAAAVAWFSVAGKTLVVVVCCGDDAPIPAAVHAMMMMT